MTDTIEDGGEHVAKTFSRLDLAEGTIRAAVFEECRFERCQFGQTRFVDCKFLECSFTDCDLSNAQVGGSRFQTVAFHGCKVIGVNWTRALWLKFATPPQLLFHQSRLDDSSFFGLSLEELVLEDCHGHDVDFREGTFSRANFSHTEFDGSLFGKTQLDGADFTEATGYDIDLFDNTLRGAKFSRDEAVRLLSGLGIELID